jgi:hypothetical protein
MRKIVIPVKIKGVNGIYFNVKVSISYNESRLSIVGTSSIMSGQINEYLESLDPKYYQLLSGWTEEMYRKLLDIWGHWHLNDMRAGCSHQRVMGWNRDDNIGEPCPVCGYRFGCSLLFEPVPDDVIEWLFSLPEQELQ